MLSWQVTGFYWLVCVITVDCNSLWLVGVVDVDCKSVAFSGEFVSLLVIASQCGFFWLVCVFTVDCKSMWLFLASLCLHR